MKCKECGHEEHGEAMCYAPVPDGNRNVTVCTCTTAVLRKQEHDAEVASSHADPRRKEAHDAEWARR